jgi:plastocyanin
MRVKRLLALSVVAAALSVPAMAASTHTISVVDDRFSRTSLTVKKGDTVRWVWKGNRRHNVYQVAGPGHFHSPSQVDGTYRHRFTKRGTYRFQCTFHTPHKMTIKVT